MKGILEDIQSGEFAKRWLLENQAGRPAFNAMRRKSAESLLIRTGQDLRAKMGWVKDKNLDEAR